MSVFGFKDLRTAQTLKEFADTLKGFGDDKIKYPEPTFTIGGGGGSKIGHPKTDDHENETWHTYVIYELNESGVATAKSPEETVEAWQESGFTFSKDVLHHLWMVESAATTSGKKWISHPHEFDNCDQSGRIIAGTAEQLTISSGTVTATKSYIHVDTEAAAASDDLTTINGGVEGMLLFINAANNNRTVNVIDGTGNIRLSGGTDFALTHAQDTILLQYNDFGNWLELSRSDNET